MGYKPQYLGHVNIYVRNVERSQQWYADLLGLHTYDYTPGRAAFMSADLNQSHEVALIEVGDEAPGPQQRQVGLNHMAWMMASLDDLKDLYQRIQEKGIAIDRVSDHGISIGIYLRDPDGNGVSEPSLAGAIQSMRVAKETRSWERPSDHVPVIVDLA